MKIIDLSNRDLNKNQNDLTFEEKDLSDIIELDLNNANISSSQIEILKRLTNLKILNISALTIDGNIIESLDEIPLEKLKQLEEVYLKYTEVKNVDKIFDNNKLIQILDLDSSPIESIDHIDSLTNLNELNLNSTKVKDISSLKKCLKLQKLSVSDSDIDKESIKVISTINSLVEITLKENEAICSQDLFILSKLDNLKSLDLDFNPEFQSAKDLIMREIHTKAKNQSSILEKPKSELKILDARNSYDEKSYFIERQNELQQVEQKLKEHGKCIVTGLSGNGKTLLSRKYAKDCQKKGYLTHWFETSSSESFLEGIMSFADILGVEKQYHQKNESLNTSEKLSIDSVTLSHDIVSKLNSASQKVLLVTDNLQDYNLINQYLPNLNDKVEILVNSSSFFPDQDKSSITLEIFKSDEAKRYINKKLGEKNYSGYDIDLLLDQVGKHPHSLAVATSVIKTMNYSIRDYIESIKYTDILSNALDCLNALNPDAFDIIVNAAFLHTDNIPLSVLSDSIFDNSVIELLHGLSLITDYNLDKQTISIHSELQNKLKNKIKENDQVKETLSKLSKTLYENFPELLEFNENYRYDDNRLQDVNTYILHVIKFLENNSNEKKLIVNNENLVSLYLSVAKYYHLIMTDFNKALSCLYQALESCNQLPFSGRTYNQLIRISNILGIVHSDLAQYDLAVHHLEMALRMLKDSDIEYNYENYGTALNNLGNEYKNCGRFDKSIECLKEALVLVEKKFGKKYSFYSIVLNNLGNAYEASKDYTAASKCLTEAYELTRENSGKHHPNLAMICVNLAKIYGVTDKNNIIREKLLLKALKIRKNIYGEGHIETTIILNNLGNYYGNAKIYGKALECHSKALQIRINKLGVNHPDTGISFGNKASSLMLVGRYEESLECQKNKIKNFSFNYGDEDERTIIERKVLQELQNTIETKQGNTSKLIEKVFNYSFNSNAKNLTSSEVEYKRIEKKIFDKLNKIKIKPSTTDIELEISFSSENIHNNLKESIQNYFKDMFAIETDIEEVEKNVFSISLDRPLIESLLDRKKDLVSDLHSK